MTRFFKNIILITLLSTFLTKFSFAQYNYVFPWYKGWEAGTNIGLNYFYGDVNDNKSRFWNNTPLSGFYYEQKRIMFDLSFGKNITPYYSIKSHFSFGNLYGSNEKLNMYFKGNILNADIDLYFHYLDYFLKRPENKKFKYYVIAGIGVSNYNSIRKQLNNNVFLGSVGYSNNGLNKTQRSTDMIFKIGMGVAYNIDKYWMINFESNLNYLSSDNLDAFTSDNTRLEGFGFMSFGLIYKFNFNIRTRNNNWKSSSGSNNRPHNSGFENKRKRKLHNKWK